MGAVKVTKTVTVKNKKPSCFNLEKLVFGLPQNLKFTELEFFFQTRELKGFNLLDLAKISI